MSNATTTTVWLTQVTEVVDPSVAIASLALLFFYSLLTTALICSVCVALHCRNGRSTRTPSPASVEFSAIATHEPVGIGP